LRLRSLELEDFGRSSAFFVGGDLPGVFRTS